MKWFPEWAEPILTLLVFVPISNLIVVAMLGLGIALRRKFNLLVRSAFVLLCAAAAIGNIAWQFGQVPKPNMVSVIINNEIRVGIGMTAILIVLIFGLVELGSKIRKRSTQLP